LKILGIDPGTNNLGYAVISFQNGRLQLIEAGVAKFRADSFKEKIKELIEALDTIFLNHQIDKVAIEDIFLAYNPKTVLKLAHFRGAIIMKVMLEFGDYSQYSPLEIKKSITGNGRATKEQVAFMVRKLLNIKKEIRPFDITDAIAVAITHYQRLKSNLK